MYILLSNDDGYQAAGLQALLLALGRAGHQVDVVAPDCNRSAASQSLTLKTPLRVSEQEGEFGRILAVTGTPADCVNLALGGLLDKRPDAVVSGINHGPNLGDDVLYSGTVAAVIEARSLGVPGLAVSQEGEAHWQFETAAQLAVETLPRLGAGVYNLNVPNCSREALLGLRPARLGSRKNLDTLLHQHDPRGRDMYWIGPPGPPDDEGPDTDFGLLAQGYAAITPIRVDMTDSTRLAAMQHVFAERR